jgi:ankyrin repeat protein
MKELVMNNTQKMLLAMSMVIGCIVVMYTQFGKKAEILDENGRTSLYQIIETNDIDAVDACIKAGSNVNHTDKNGLTPLQFTTQLRIHKNSGEMAQLLIKAGADMTVKNETGYSLLQMAVEKRNNFVVAALVNAGMDVNLQDSVDGCTPLHKAIIQACTAAIKDYQGLVTCPCCVEAMFTKSVAIAQTVLNAGADTTIKNNNDHTAQDIIEVMFAKVTLGGHTQSDIYYDAQDLVDKPEDFDTKIASKFQILRDLFVA